MPENIANLKMMHYFFGERNAKIKLKMKEVAPSKVVLALPATNFFTLIANIDAVSDDSCDVKLDFEGEFNAMMAMMIRTYR
jgi:hypothetical protein